MVKESEFSSSLPSFSSLVKAFLLLWRQVIFVYALITRNSHSMSKKEITWEVKNGG